MWYTSEAVPGDLLVVLGPTASGKTQLSVALAERFGGEIISADSRQVFRGMDIGTGKDLAEYRGTHHHLIDVAEPGSEFSVFAFQNLFLDAHADITARGCLPILVGGTGLYLEAALANYRLQPVPENPALRNELAHLDLPALVARLQQLTTDLHNTTDLTDRDRLLRAIEITEHRRTTPPVPMPKLAPLVLGIRWERRELQRRITLRLKERLAAGLVEEVARLRASGVNDAMLDYYGLEYRFVTRHLRGELNHNDLFQKLNSAIHDF
ncbi:MAG TPA: tRNA (adenosine(37)-N6)-dimethylallyltransferase MiaA, partial [Geobacteraceae bacterium]